MGFEEEPNLEERYANGLTALDSINDGTARFIELRDGVLRACEDARRYSKDDDFNVEMRKKDADFLKERKSLKKAAEKISYSISRYRIHTRAILSQAQVHNRFGNIGGATGWDGKVTNIEENFEKILDAYLSNVRAELPSQTGLFLHRVMVGPLVYPEAIDRRSSKIVPSVTGLIFQLVLYFRRYSSGEINPTKLSKLEAMTSAGKPYYNIVCEFLQDALDHPTEAHAVEERLRKLIKNNHGISFSDWPQNIDP